MVKALATEYFFANDPATTINALLATATTTNGNTTITFAGGATLTGVTHIDNSFFA